MKLERTTLFAATALLALAGCASSAPPPAAPVAPPLEAVATTELTSSSLGGPEAPHVGKSQRGLDAESQLALDPKRTASREGKRPRAVFTDWK